MDKYESIVDDKKKLRSYVKGLTSLFCRDRVAVSIHSKQITLSLMRSVLWQNAKTVLLYMSEKSEVDTLPLIDCAIKQGKRVALPKVKGKGEMDFYYIKNNVPLFDQLETGTFGIKEPFTDDKADAVTSSALIVAPGIAFTEDGWRLGRGAGYYDRYIERMGRGGGVAGLCFPCQIVEHISHDKHDKKMDKVFYS